MTMWAIVRISDGVIVCLTDDLETAIDEMGVMNKRNYNYYVKKSNIIGEKQ